MAVAITAPAPASTAGDVGVSDEDAFVQVIAGNAFPDFVGTTTTSGGNVRIDITGERASVDVSVTFAATLLAFTSAGKLVYKPQAPGKYTVKITDVTSGDSASQTIVVFGSEGV